MINKLIFQGKKIFEDEQHYNRIRLEKFLPRKSMLTWNTWLHLSVKQTATIPSSIFLSSIVPETAPKTQHMEREREKERDEEHVSLLPKLNERHSLASL